MVAARGRSSSRQRWRQPLWEKWRTRWWWKDDKAEEGSNGWRPQEEFDQKTWNEERKAEAKAEEPAESSKTWAEKEEAEARAKSRSELTAARSSAIAATKAWGHGDPLAKGLLVKLDGLYDRRRAKELSSREHLEALTQELDSLAAKFNDLTLESKRLMDRQTNIASEQAYLQERAKAMQDQKDALTAAMSAEEAATSGSGALPSSSGSGALPSSSGGAAATSLKAAGAAAAASTTPAADARINNLEAQVSGVATQLSMLMTALQGAQSPCGAGWSSGSWNQPGWWQEQWGAGPSNHSEYRMDDDDDDLTGGLETNAAEQEYPAEYLDGAAPADDRILNP
jgi:DNA repair exonuclease SbcCD ATPase subunit